jgi:hypothetical protein
MIPCSLYAAAPFRACLHTGQRCALLLFVRISVTRLSAPHGTPHTLNQLLFFAASQTKTLCEPATLVSAAA